MPAERDPRNDHEYVEHPTYTGPGCAMCGRLVTDHTRQGKWAATAEVIKRAEEQS